MGTALAAIVYLAGAGGTTPWLVFVVSSLLTVAVLRLITRARAPTPSPTPTGSAALVGKPAVVLERIINQEGVGCVKINGEVWTARALHDEHVIERGTRVEIVDIKGATALVSGIEERPR